MAMNFSSCSMNFSSCSVFPTTTRSADDDFASAMRHWGTADAFGVPDWLSWAADVLGDYGGEADSDGSYDPADLLPSDPFEMELSTTFSAAIAGWIEDFGATPGDYEVGGYEVGGDDLIYYSNWALLPSSSETQLGAECAFDGWMEGGLLGLSMYGSQYVDGYSSSVGAEASHSGGEGTVPHEGLLFALGYLGLQDLLSVEMVCRSLRSAVQSDTLLWRCIHIDSPLSERITDDDLLRLTQRAQGSLQCLNLVGCPKITDEGLMRVLERNRRLKKLGVSGCVRLSIEGLIHNLKALKSSGMPGVKHLTLGRLFSISPEQFEELTLLVDGDRVQQAKAPRFYHKSFSSPITCEDDRAIDIELCSGCQKFKLVFDCTSQSCQGKGPNHCRACEICIARCVHCGRCVNNCKYVETFCLEYLCASCWDNVPQSPEKLEEK